MKQEHMANYKEYSKAFVFARNAHRGQLRNNGQPYFTHPKRVADAVNTNFQKVCALLHDVVEDTDITIYDIYKEFGRPVAETVLWLTRDKKEDYQDYIEGICGDKDAVAIKIADILDNLGDNPSQKAIEKSLKALPVLFAAR